MRGIRWIDKKLAIKLHDDFIVELGGVPGLLDERKLESALERPKNAQYDEGINDPYELAGIIVDAISNAHSFCDGNKRTALAAGVVFLGLNGYFPPYEEKAKKRFNEEAAELTKRLSAHDNEEQFTATDIAAFFRENVLPIE